MGIRTIAVIAALAVIGCVNNHKTRCLDSVEARAAGRYADPAAEKQAYDGKHYSCISACYDLFDTGMSLDAIKASDVCVEDALLMATVDPLKAKEDLVAGCRDGAGNVNACAWVEANKDKFAVWEAEAARATAARMAEEERLRAARGPDVTEMTMTPDEYVSHAKAAALNNGYSVMIDATYDLSSGYAAFEFQTQQGVGYIVLLVARDSTSFTARVDGWGTEPIPMYSPTEVPNGVFVRTAAFELGDATDTSPQIVWYAEAGDYGDVRALVFSK